MGWENYTYHQMLEIIREIKFRYKGILLSFSIFTGKETYKYIRQIKNKIYALNFENWKKDKLWEYLNDDVEYDLLTKI